MTDLQALRRYAEWLRRMSGAQDRNVIDGAVDDLLSRRERARRARRDRE
ncbi:hypothetical protein [Jiella marina]|nr:hypothetical protein [Jiella sp. LLJ827]MCQ0986378.1 hypothetical protein [Jiella sp. LLJ827]